MEHPQKKPCSSLKEQALKSRLTSDRVAKDFQTNRDQSLRQLSQSVRVFKVAAMCSESRISRDLRGLRTHQL